MGRTGHSALLIGISATLVMATGVVVSLTRSDEPVAHAETTLGPVHDANVVSANGLSRPARAGTLLAPGDVITTGPTGNAQLLTRGRITLLTANAVLAVRDGAHQQLRTGTAVIDAQEGPALTVDLAGDTLVVPTGSATEADRSAAVRIGSLAGPASVTNGSGRELSVAALWQVIVNGDALPGSPTPLQLSDVTSVRDAEARAVPELVADNLAMDALARGINSTGNSTAHVVEAAWTGSLVPRGVGVSRSDQVLPAVIADATPHAGGSAQQRYDRVVGWRADGGSWGVVIHLLSARAAQVADTLHSLQQQTQKVGTVGKISAHGLGVTPIGPVSAPGGGNKPSGGHTSPSTGVPPTRPPKTTPPGGGGSTPTPKPTPAANLLGGIVGTVGQVLNTLLSLLPSDSATAKPQSLKAQPQPSSSTTTATTTVAPAGSPSPTSTATSSGLVGDVVGGVVGGLTGQ